MAETCIVCLGDLAPQDEGNAAATDASLAIDSLDDPADASRHLSKLQQVVAAVSSAPAPDPKDDELVAHLLPCGHNLHNDCLKPWVERANSCPICRASFNMVELSERVGGPMISSYAVQDKQQVADIDPSMIIEEDYIIEDDGSYDACMVCDEFGDSSLLMFCHSCEQLCHVFCAGLDRMPARSWYCQGCRENPESLTATARRGTPRGPAAYVNGRPRLSRRAGGPDEWVGVWQSVWDRLHFDIEFPFEDDEQSDNRSEAQRRENLEWERRFALARRLGAGNRFRAATDNVHVRPSQPRARAANNALHHEPPKTPKNPESQEELRAWNQFEKAREQVAEMEARPSPGTAAVGASNSNSRGRKRKSANSSPIEPEPQEREPERKLKRPRTRLNLDTAESSNAAIRRGNVTNYEQAASSPSAAIDASAAPGFLQSLLEEVAVDKAEQEREIVAPQPKRVIVERACSPQNSSPGLSPVIAVYPTPQGMTTPPPLNLNRSKSPKQIDEPQLSPTYSPYSPADDDGRQSRRKLPLRSAGLSSPPRSKDSSPSRSASLSYTTKAEIQRMVTFALKPLYLKKDITKDEYTEVNRDVSRLLYDRVGDSGADALVNKDNREKWQKMAADEVDNAVQALRADGPPALSSADDSASSSS